MQKQETKKIKIQVPLSIYFLSIFIGCFATRKADMVIFFEK